MKEAARRDILLWVLLAAGLALRVPGLFDDFWLDEIWAWRER